MVIDGEPVGSITAGLVVLAAFGPADTTADMEAPNGLPATFAMA